MALRLAFERLVGARPQRSVSLPLQPIKTAGDGADTLARIAESVASGAVSPAEGVAVATIVESAVRAFEVRDFERRLEQVEEKFRNAAIVEE